MQATGRSVADEEHRIEVVIRRVRASVNERVSDAVVEARVRASFAEWDGAPVRDFVPLLAERRALDVLRSTSTPTAF